jgi:1,5-anhydro-D-fructose reductase (1,5-anhydro-D-mannitol-forming)
MRWGIIGLGDIAERNFTPALALAADSELVSIASRSLDRARAFAAKYAVAHAFDSIGRMLADPALDAVYIASPNGLHAEQAIAAARAGKHVLVDKPMALCVADCERMIRACDDHGVRLGVAFRNRYHPAHIDVRRHVMAGALGDVQMARAQLFVGGVRGHWKGWRVDPLLGGSGSIVGQAVHPVDLLRFVLDSEVESVCCVTDEAPPARPVDEMTFTILTFRNGAHAMVGAGVLAPHADNDVVVYGSRARISCRGTLGTPRGARPQTAEVEGQAGDIEVRCPADDTAVTRTARLIEEFSSHALHGTATVISAQNGLQMVRIAEAMLESSRRGKTVRL